MIYVIGIGPGSIDYVLPRALKVMGQCEVIIGFQRAINTFSHIEKKKYIINAISEIIGFINENKEKNIGILASGDPGFYGISDFINRNYDGDIEIIPGLSSFQYMTSKLNKSWSKAYLGSVHGREESFIERVLESELTIWLTDKKFSPDFLANMLIKERINALLYVGENLSYEDENIYVGNAEQIAAMEFSGLSVLIVERLQEKGEDHEIY